MAKARSRSLFYGSLYIFFVTGALVLTTNAILPDLTAEYGIPYDLAGLLVSLQAAGYLIGNLIGGGLGGRFGSRKVLYACVACYIAGFAGVLVIPWLAPLYILLFVTGVGWGVINNIVNVLVSQEAARGGGSLLVLHAVYGIGAFVAPLAVGALQSAGMGWRWVVGAVLLLSILILPLVGRMRIPALPFAEKGRRAPVSFSFLRHIPFYSAVLVFFLYVGAEAAINGWLVFFLEDKPYFSFQMAQNMLSLLWVLMIVGRLLTAVIAPRIRARYLLVIESAAFLGGMLVLLWAPSFGWTVAAVSVMGLSMAGIYGTNMSEHSALMAQSGVVSGLLLAGGGLGSSVMPLCAGVAAKQGGTGSGMALIAVVVGALTLLSVLGAAHRRAEPVRRMGEL